MFLFREYLFTLWNKVPITDIEVVRFDRTAIFQCKKFTFLDLDFLGSCIRVDLRTLQDTVDFRDRIYVVVEHGIFRVFYFLGFGIAEYYEFINF